MITSNALLDILVEAVLKTDLKTVPEIAKGKHGPVSINDNHERVVLITNAADNAGWQKAYCRIVAYVPDLQGTPNTLRLKQVEAIIAGAFSGEISGTYDGHRYRYSIEDVIQEEDPTTWSHFINARIKFQILNLKKL